MGDTSQQNGEEEIGIDEERLRRMTERAHALDTDSKLGAFLLAAEDENITQDQIGDAVGCSQSYVSRILQEQEEAELLSSLPGEKTGHTYQLNPSGMEQFIDDLRSLLPDDESREEKREI